VLARLPHVAEMAMGILRSSNRRRSPQRSSTSKPRIRSPAGLPRASPESNNMKQIIVIGIGTGNPEQITLEAVKALNSADVVFVLDKGEQKTDLTRLRRDICSRFAANSSLRWVEVPSPVRDASTASYKEGVRAWHAAKAQIFGALIRDQLKDGERGAILAWGDPSIYDSTIRILHDLATNTSAQFELEIIPGISSIQVLAARHKIALNAIGEPVLITTGRKLSEGIPNGIDTIVVMLDGGSGLEAITGKDLDIYWGAYLGSEDEILMAGNVRDVLDEIKRIREARRPEKGWIMDIYLLRRRSKVSSAPPSP
jgi:precorrin-6A synthase